MGRLTSPNSPPNKGPSANFSGIPVAHRPVVENGRLRDGRRRQGEPHVIFGQRWTSPQKGVPLPFHPPHPSFTGCGAGNEAGVIRRSSHLQATLPPRPLKFLAVFHMRSILLHLSRSGVRETAQGPVCRPSLQTPVRLAQKTVLNPSRSLAVLRRDQLPAFPLRLTSRLCSCKRQGLPADLRRRRGHDLYARLPPSPPASPRTTSTLCLLCDLVALLRFPR